MCVLPLICFILVNYYFYSKNILMLNRISITDMIVILWFEMVAICLVTN